MKIQLAFDRQIMNRYQERGRNLFFGICWKHEGVSYPSSDWMDFGSVILGWWLTSFTHLLVDRTPQNFSFMEGQFQINLEIDGDQVNMTFTDRLEIWRVSTEEVMTALRAAVLETIKYCQEYSIRDSESVSLNYGLAHLETVYQD